MTSKDGEILPVPENELEKVNSNLPAEVNDNLISDEALLGIYGKIMENIDSDRKEVSNLIDNFAEMVINGGDSTTSSKEALINLIKVKSDTADKMAKVADLMTRIKLREKNTMPDWQKAKANQSGNTINIIDQTGLNRRAILEEINKARKENA